MPEADTHEEPRIRRLLIAARAGMQPWQDIPAAKLTEVARQCSVHEVAETIEEMDMLCRARAGIPAWDDDAQDGIGKTQEMYTRILGQVADSLLPEVAKGLGSPQVETRRWVVLAIEMHGKPAAAMLRQAMTAEKNEAARKTYAGALARLER